ncbi:hypothetical protein [Burkholderia sp. Ac-20365]|uniref:hypothetical protein n=1 Tax=Burkholderia sp. Ac-20365 TaxID=2703897 RepID=UPI00197C891B|nr:hypothetical protein [Burkholderia sp. Ac-20365]MBN3763561.1 hypothetical protein [Burkholderia sp. Ac-20365]
MGKPSRTALFSAARNWDWASVDSLLNAAPELIEASEPGGQTALPTPTQIRRFPIRRVATA